jgi:hypothetical protein
MVGFCEHGFEISFSIKEGKFLTSREIIISLKWTLIHGHGSK